MQLWKHPNGTYYVLYGPRLKKRSSSRTKDRREAEIYLSQFIAGSQEPALDAPTVSQILDGYEKDRAPTLRSPLSLKYGSRHLHGRLGNLLPEHLTPTTIKRFAAER